MDCQANQSQGHFQRFNSYHIYTNRCSYIAHKSQTRQTRMQPTAQAGGICGLNSATRTSRGLWCSFGLACTLNEFNEQSRSARALRWEKKILLFSLIIHACAQMDVIFLWSWIVDRPHHGCIYIILHSNFFQLFWG